MAAKQRHRYTERGSHYVTVTVSTARGAGVGINVLAKFQPVIVDIQSPPAWPPPAWPCLRGALLAISGRGIFICLAFVSPRIGVSDTEIFYYRRYRRMRLGVRRRAVQWRRQR